MFKRGARPCLPIAAETLSPTATRLRGCSCHLSTRSRSQPIHSTAIVGIHRRPDHNARTEFYGPGGADIRGIISFRNYQKQRASFLDENYTDAPNRVTQTPSGLDIQSLPALLKAYKDWSASGQRPRREAYLALLSATADFSVDRASLNFERQRYQDAAASKQARALSQTFIQDQGETSLGWKMAWSAWEDARLGDIELGVEGFDLLLKAASPHPHLLPSLIHHALDSTSLASALTSESYDAFLSSPGNDQNIEQLMLVVLEMYAKRVELPKGRPSQIISSAGSHGLVRLALDLAVREETHSRADLEPQVWVEILRHSAEKQFVDGVQASWERIVETGIFLPDEGLCTLVLNCAGRHHRPDLAASAIEMLGQQSIQPKEYHFAPLLEALCGAERISDAMETLNLMQRSGFTTNLAISEPIVEALSRTVEDVDKGFYGLQALKATGKTIDIAAFNAVLKGAEKLGDANRAMVIYRQAGGFEVVPNLETYHILLSACVKAEAVAPAEFLLKEMGNAKEETGDIPLKAPISYDTATYELLVALYLTQSSYEKAFEYLAVMKEQKIRPSLAVYEGLVRKCVDEGDSRSQQLLQEMQAGQYKPSTDLVRYIRNASNPKRAGERYQAEGTSKSINKKPRSAGRNSDRQ